MQDSHHGVKTTRLNEFVELFSEILPALLNMAYGHEYANSPNNDVRKDYEERNGVIHHKLNLLFTIPRDPSPNDSGIFWSMMKEIETNLYALSESKVGMEVYIKRLIREFRDISPYFDSLTKVDEGDPRRGPTFPFAKFSHELLAKFYTLKETFEDFSGPTNGPQGIITTSRQIEFEDLTIVEQYIVACNNVLATFANLLDVKCLSFGINIVCIQESIQIRFLRERDWLFLWKNGFTKREVSNITGHSKMDVDNTVSFQSYTKFMSGPRNSPSDQSITPPLQNRVDNERGGPSKPFTMSKEVIDGIVEILYKHFEPKDHDDLKRAFGGIEINRKLTFTGDAKNKLTHIFWRLWHPRKIIVGTQENVASWIVNTFQYKNSLDEVEPFDKKSVLRDLQGVDSRTKGPIPEIEAFFSKLPLQF